MTIAAGFRCFDGVVLCTDSEHTVGQSKFYEAKIFEAKADNALVYVTGAGDYVYIHSVADGINRLLEYKTVSLDQIEAAAESVISEHYQGTFLAAQQAHDPNAPTMEFLMSARVRGDTSKLYRIRATGALSRVSGGYVALGTEVAEALLRELADTFFQGWDISVFPMRHLAVHIIHRVVSYAAYCGGSAQVACLADSGHSYFSDDASSEPGEDFLGYLTMDMSAILEACITGNREAFEACTDRLYGRLRDAMEKSRAKYEQHDFIEVDGWGS